MKLKEALVSELFVKRDVLAKEVDDCLDRIAKISQLGNDYDAIKLSETIIDYLNRKYVRYKGAMKR